jgi:hypothetical protein
MSTWTENSPDDTIALLELGYTLAEFIDLTGNVRADYLLSMQLANIFPAHSPLYSSSTHPFFWTQRD